jgi:hypothetical protein
VPAHDCPIASSPPAPPNTPRSPAKYRAARATGQPLLIGTRTIKNSEVLVKARSPLGLTLRVLNAKQVAGKPYRARRVGAITIATNIAGGAHTSRCPTKASAPVASCHRPRTPRSARIDRQLIGRAAGAAGSAQFSSAWRTTSSPATPRSSSAPRHPSPHRRTAQPLRHSLSPRPTKSRSHRPLPAPRGITTTGSPNSRSALKLLCTLVPREAFSKPCHPERSAARFCGGRCGEMVVGVRGA